MSQPHHCVLCGGGPIEQVLDFGPQALSNRFLKTAGEPEALFPLALGQCRGCGLMQLREPPPASEVKARVDWLTYNEQEAHLDALVENVRQLPGVDSHAQVGAISYKDDSTVERFRKKGHARAWRLDPRADLGIDDPCAGLETIQSALTPEKAAAIADRRGKSDILIARHILEHTHDQRQFAAALRALVKPDGYIVFEVPDCVPALTRFDYTMPWEEHISYFTPSTCQRALAALGMSVKRYDCYIYANENSLVAITQPGATAAITADNFTTAKRYAAQFGDVRQRAAEKLREQRALGRRVAMFGAGHLSCAWVNFLGLRDHIDFFVDDHPRKLGLFMPGSRLPIRPSSALLAEKIDLCLLSLSPESEAKVLAKNAAYTAQGGVFASIFPGKANSFI